MTTILANDIHGVDRHGPGSPDSLETVYSWMPPDADVARYVSPNGDDSNDGKSPGSAVLTIAQAELICPADGTIFLLSGTHSSVPVAFSNAKALIGPGQFVCKVNIAATSTGDGFTFANAGWTVFGFSQYCDTASLDFALAATAPFGQIDDWQCTAAASGISLTNGAAGSTRIGTRGSVTIFDPTTDGIYVQGDGGLELILGDINVTLQTGTSYVNGLHVERTTATDVGGIYLGRLRVTTQFTTGVYITSTVANTIIDVFGTPDTIIDGALGNAVLLNNIANAGFVGSWLTCAGTNISVASITGGANNSFAYCVMQPSGTGAAFDISGGTVNLTANGNRMAGGTMFKVGAGVITGTRFAHNRGYTTLSDNDAALIASVNVADTSGLRVLTSGATGNGVFQLKNIQTTGTAPGKSFFWRVNNNGNLEVLDDTFSTILFTFKQSGELDVHSILAATGDFYANGALNHLGTFLQFFNAGGTTKQTVTGSRGGNAALASLLTKLAAYGLITDSSTA